MFRLLVCYKKYASSGGIAYGRWPEAGKEAFWSLGGEDLPDGCEDTLRLEETGFHPRFYDGHWHEDEADGCPRSCSGQQITGCRVGKDGA